LELKPQSLLTYGVGSSKKEGILIEAINEVPEELWSARLGLKLLAERTNPDSDYWPYVRQLPAAFGGVPLFFSPEEVEALQYPPLQAQVRKRGLFLNDFAKDTLPKYSEAFNGVSLDINALGWAMTAVSSRAFRLGGPGRPAALLPLADMANHDAAAKNAEVVRTEGGGAALRAARDLAPGAALALDYGALPNDFFLLDYGFVVPDNPHDYAELGFSPGLFWTAQLVAGVLPDEDAAAAAAERPLERWQAERLEGLGLTGPGASVRLFRDGVEGRLLAAARVLCADAAPAGTEGGGGGVAAATLAELQDPAHRVDPAVEARAARSLVGACLFALGAFPTTIEQDERALRDTPGMGANLRLALAFRLEKKRLLRAAIETLGAKLRSGTAAAVGGSSAAGAAAAASRSGVEGGDGFRTKKKRAPQRGQASTTTNKGKKKSSSGGGGGSKKGFGA